MDDTGESIWRDLERNDPTSAAPAQELDRRAWEPALMLNLAQNELRGEAQRIYERVCGKAVDREYEAQRRPKMVAMILSRTSAAARRIIWC